MSVHGNRPSFVTYGEHAAALEKAEAVYKAELKYRQRIGFQNGAIIFGIIGLVGGFLLSSWAAWALVVGL